MINIENNNNITHITLNRPQVNNAFNAAMIQELTELFRSISQSDSCHVVVLQAEGNNFCAGGDLNWMKDAAGYTHAENVADAQKLADMLYALYTLPQTTVCVTKGAVYGGGVGLVAACDIAIGMDNTKFCLSEVKLGLIPAVISPYVIEAIGARYAKRFFTTAESFGAAKATEIGLLQNTFDTYGELEFFLTSILENLSSIAPEARGEAKKLVTTFAGQPITKEISKLSATLIADRRATDEAKEGIAAFLEKRSPNWRRA